MQKPFSRPDPKPWWCRLRYVPFGPPLIDDPTTSLSETSFLTREPQSGSFVLLTNGISQRGMFDAKQGTWQERSWSERNFVLVLDDGEEAFASITRFCEENNITGASLTAIGAFRQANLGFFDFSRKSYIDIPVETQSEVLSAIGDVAIDDEGQQVFICTRFSASQMVQPKAAISSAASFIHDGDHNPRKRGGAAQTEEARSRYCAIDV